MKTLNIGTLWPWLVLAGFISLLAVVSYLQGPRGAIRSGMQGLGHMWTIAMWLFPPILLGIAYVFPALREAATITISDAALRSIIWPVVLGGLWLVFQVLAAGNTNTSYRTLQLDLAVSFMWGLVFSGLVVHHNATGTLQYWHVIPALFTVPEAFINTVVAINNAFQKNPTQMQKGE